MNPTFTINLRKDLLLRSLINKQTDILLGSVLLAYKTRYHINALVNSDKNITNTLDQKEDSSSIPSAVILAIDEIQKQKQDVINELNAIRKSITDLKIEVLEEITTTTNFSKTEILDEKDKAIIAIQNLASDVSDELTNLATGVKDSLILKIDYLFMVFYHKRSGEIMYLYPLEPN